MTARMSPKSMKNKEKYRRMRRPCKISKREKSSNMDNILPFSFVVKPNQRSIFGLRS
ncbi:uncharacterized protein LOC111123098 isoform X4 [Crassostrea virginica]